MSDIESKIIEITSITLRVDKSKITSDSRFLNDLGADSLDIVELMMAIEAEFDCNIPDDAASKIVTVSDAVKYIKENANK